MEKERALAEHLDMDMFKHGDEYYVGDEDALLADFEHQKDEYSNFGEYLEAEAEKLEYAIEQPPYGNYEYEAEGGEYLVMTDDEADEVWDERLEGYLDDCVLCDLPDIAQRYFDKDAWKKDAKYDGRGHSISYYDGHEHEVTIDDTDYYIYRIN